MGSLLQMPPTARTGPTKHGDMEVTVTVKNDMQFFKLNTAYDQAYTQG